MNKIALFILALGIIGCSNLEGQTKEQTQQIVQSKAQHKYGGWYCPDNLNGFPAVDINNWEDVPVVNGRLPSQEEARNGTSLIYIDTTEYPNAKAIDIILPKLAEYYNEFTRKKEHIIVIQAINIDSDSIVGFRFVNGGNGSARMKDVHFMSDDEIAAIPNSDFVVFKTNIQSTQENIWKVMTDTMNLNSLTASFSSNIKDENEWRDKTNVNYFYSSAGVKTSAYADLLFGNFYVQNDYVIDGNAYVEKFLLLENAEENYTELKIVCGPYSDDFKAQKGILERWAEKVKGLSEL
jgi:hypothetical protein